MKLYARKFGDVKSHTVYAEGNSKPVATVKHADPAEQVRFVNLFTAAPDLLLACRAIQEDIEHQLMDERSPGTRQTLEIQHGFLSRAIAKATGRA